MIRALVLAAALLGASSPAFAEESETQTFEAAAVAISSAMAAHHYDPASLDDPAYRAIENQVAELARQPQTAKAFARGFNAIWREGPFSHVRLDPARGTAADTAQYLDTLNAGEGAVSLSWEGDVAILAVNTMMGRDTIERIDTAYETIAETGARALVIDLRENGGGAFAVKPLVSHLLAEPLDAGAFVSQRWAREKGRAPTLEDISGVAPWTGWSVVAFWRDVQADLVTRIRFEPQEPVYAGPVYVLTSHDTASAAEMAADALAASGRAKLVGERTAGQMLSQSLFDIPQGLTLSLPVADYYAFHTGRIEGRGVASDVEIEADEAMAKALELAGG